MKRYLIIITLFFATLLSAEEFNIKKFSDPAKYNWKNMEDRFEARKELDSKLELLQIYKQSKQPILTNMMKSAIAPGWGHYSAKNYIKGHALIASEIVLFGTSLYFYVQALDDFNKYEDSHYIGDIKQYYLDANNNYRYSQLFFSLGALVWIYTIYDSISATQEYNQNLWNDLSKKLHSQKVVITPTSITLRF